MNVRYCPRCGTDVEDAGGFCLLGHPLRLHLETQSLSDLRAEVDRAFEEARVQVAAALGPIASSPEGARHEPPSAPPAPSRQETAHRPAPPPPPAPSVWRALEAEEPTTQRDPIVAFSPAPRMDWGPEKSGLRSRRRGPA
ncbi:MAG: hypothetical protein ABR575_10895 [Actinomycetota bacterium]